MLKVNNLTIKTIKDNRILVNDLSFILNDNDKIAVIGEEGVGKSTLLKAIYDSNLIPHCDIKGNIKIEGTIMYLEQNIIEYWGDYSVYDYFLKEKPDSDFLDYNLLARIPEILSKLNISISDRKMNSFSGGEVVKLGLAKVLLYEPDILILDEPSNDLDFQTIVFLEDFINNYPHGILYVSHDEALLENTSLSIIHLFCNTKKHECISTYMNLPYDQYKEFRLNKLSSQRTIALKQRSEYKAKLERFNQIFNKVAYRQNQCVRDPGAGRLLKKKMKSLKSMEKRFEREKDNFLEIPSFDEEIEIFFNDDCYIENGKVVLDYYLDRLMINDMTLVKDIRLHLEGPARICIIGNNGIGKTTLLKDIYQKMALRRDITVGYMPQFYDDYLLNHTALDFLMPEPDKVLEGKIRKMMGALKFTREEMLNDCIQLSSGQKAKLFLLKLVIDNCNVIILDEPTRNLSPLSIPCIYELLNSYKGTIIAVTHDRKFIENCFDDIYELTKDGLIKQ